MSYSTVHGRSVVPAEDLLDPASAVNLDSHKGIGKKKGVMVYRSSGNKLQLYIAQGRKPSDAWEPCVPGGAGTPTEVLADLLDVATDTPQKDYRLIFDGTEWRMVPEGTTFNFSINSFTALNFSTGTILAGTPGTSWLPSSTVTYSGSYENGPATSEIVTSNQAGFISVVLSGNTLDTVNNLTYPSTGSSITVTLTATDGATVDTLTKTASFHNYIYYGKSLVESSITAAGVQALANSEITGDTTQTWDSVTCNAGEYFWFCWPTRLGNSFTFYDNDTGFGLDVQSSETVAVPNSNGLTEFYYAVRSTYPNLGILTVRTT